MKRILSIVLAAALIISLVPAFALASDTQEGIITYNIVQGSVSDAAFDGEIIAPTDMDPTSANFGKIKFTGGTYATKTIKNILKNSEGLFAKGDSSLANSETTLVTYRTIDYHAYVTKDDGTTVPVRKPANSYSTYVGKNGSKKGFKVVSDGSSEIKTYTISNTLDLTKTAPFEMFGKSLNSSHGFLYEETFVGSFNYGTTNTPDVASAPDKWSFALRIKVPEDAASGKYTVRIGTDSTRTGLYAPEYSAETDVYITKIDPTIGLEGQWVSNSGAFYAFTDANGNVLSENAYASTDNQLTGTWYPKEAMKKEFPDIRTFEAGSEYLVYFRINPERSIKTNADNTKNLFKHTDNKYYQNLLLTTIELIPVAEDIPAVLVGASVKYDEGTKTVSVSSAKMNDGTDATGYTVTYGMTGATNAKINAATGVITPGTEDETITVYADVTLDGVTVRATLSDIEIKGYVEGRLKYLIGADALNDAAKAEISALDGDAALIRNSEMILVSWKELSYLNTNKVPVKVAPGTEGAKTVSNILNLNATEKFELPGRSVEDNSPRLLAEGLASQFVGRRWKNAEEIQSQSYLAENYTSRPKYMIKIYIPEKGAYKLSVANNFTLNTMGNLYGGDFFVKEGSNYTSSLGRESWTEVYFSKAEYDLPYGSAAPTLTKEQLIELLSDENRVGWYDSGRYGKVTKYDKVVVAPEAGEYYVTFTTSPESYEKNNEFWHRGLDGGTFVDYQLFALSEIRLDPTAEDAEYEESFDAEVEDYTTSGKAIVDAYTFAGEEAILSANNEVVLGNTFNVTAPEIEGYNFLYWAKGTSESKLVVSYENELTFKPSEGRNSLIAVYAEESAEVNRAEFYNANGTLIKTLTADGKAPEYPSMAGYGNADGWQLYGSETIYGAGEDIAVSGNMIFVAKYPETPATVIVNGTEYTYGETVTMPELDSSKIFKGWKRNDEIVSVNPNYTFKAYANATVEAVYADKEPVFSGSFMKIVIDSFKAGTTEDAVMAEFIGMDNAVEKGIMIGSKRIAMKGNGNQFTILADVPNTTYVGYAILKNGTTFTQVIDGAFPN